MSFPIFGELEEETQSFPEYGEIEKKAPKRKVARDVAEQVAVKGTAGAVGAYGNLLDLLRAQIKQRMLPGQEALTQAEFSAPESVLPFLQDDDIIPRYSRLPSGQEALELLRMSGAPVEGVTPQGRIAGRGAEFVGGALPFGGSGKLLAALGAAGLGGQGVREAGGPEALATGIEVAPAVASLASLAKGVIPKKTPVTKPSGLATRKFEDVKRPTKIFPETHRKTIQSIDQDFRNLSDQILRKSNKTYTALQEDPEFKSKIGDLFRKVESSANEFTEPVMPMSLVKNLTNDLEKIGKKGLTMSDAEKVQRRLTRRFIKDSTKNVTAKQLLDQYRKNNEELSKLFPYGDKAFENLGRREALEGYNRAIASTIQDNFRGSEFADLFKFTNQRWSEIKKAETVGKYVDALLKGDKIAFRQAEKLLTDPKKAERLKNALGKEAFEDFRQLNKDLLSQENALKLLKSKGVKLDDLPTAAAAYILKPAFAKTKFGLDFVSKIYRTTLSQPKKVRIWRNALKDLKKGKVQDSISSLSSLAATDDDLPTNAK